MLTIGKSELEFKEIRINILNALERRYTFFNGYK